MGDIEFRSLTKRFGGVLAVDDLTFSAPAGSVTGFLGPNGAGKTTSLRSLLGLVRPTSGQALVGGRPYSELREPWRAVGAVLESASANPGRTGRDQLRVIASMARLPRKRVDDVLEQVDLTGAANRRVSTYSAGMRQRLGLAAALLGEPEVLVLDEPANGLDPEGIAWLRSMLRGFAAEGRTVLISSHVLSEVAQTVDRVVIISRGVLRYSGALAGLGRGAVNVRSGDAARLAALLEQAGFSVAGDGAGLEVRGATGEEIGRIAAANQVALSELSDSGVSLEAAFLRLTGADESSPRPEGARRRRVATN